MGGSSPRAPFKVGLRTTAPGSHTVFAPARRVGLPPVLGLQGKWMEVPWWPRCPGQSFRERDVFPGPGMGRGLQGPWWLTCLGMAEQSGDRMVPCGLSYFVLLLVDIWDMILGSQVWGQGAVLSLWS